MKFTLSAYFRVLGAFFLTTALSIGAFSSTAHASNTSQFDIATIITLANADRAANGAPALTEDTLLDYAAQLKANDMAAKGYFAHVSPDGKTPWYWFKQVGYYYYDAGENLAQGFADEETLNTAWMNSPTHRANIMNPVYKKVGIGVATGMYEGRQVVFVAQEFANPYMSEPTLAKAPAVPTVAQAVTTSVPQTITVNTSAATVTTTLAPAVQKSVAAKKPVRRTTMRVSSVKRAAVAAVLPKKRVSVSRSLAVAK